MRAGRIAGWSALVAALLVSAGALLPIPPQLVENRLDPSFAATLHFAAARGFGVGTRLISTFGPLGFVFYAQYLPETFVWLLGLRALLAAATCWALAWLGYAAWGTPWGSAVALFLCVPFLASPDVWFLTLPLLAVLVELPAGRTPPLSLRLSLGAAIGLVALIKFTFLLAALVVLVPMLAAELIARRRLSPVASAALAVAAAAWLAAGQAAADVPAYLVWSAWDVSRGYTHAMQLPTDGLLVLHAAAVSMAVLGGGIVLVQRRLRVGRWAADLALAGVVFLLFRAGFVRADVHVFITCFGLLVIALLLALSWGHRPVELAAGALLVVLLPGGLCAHALAVHGAPTMYFPPILPNQAIRRLATAPLLLTSDLLERAHARRAADLRAASPLPSLLGPVDVYSHDQAVVLAHGLEFRPRPVFHSYMAYTPRLAAANAEFLRAASAPEWILFRVSPVDSGFPALDDATSWPLLMTRYRFVEPAGVYALLQRRATPLPWRLEPLGRVDTVTGSSVAVPSAAAGPIWARVDVAETWRDELLAAVLAPPLTYIGIARSDGQTSGYRLLPALAREGFVLSPLVESTADFIRLMSLQPDGERAHDAAALTVQVAEAPGFAPEPHTVAVEFFRLVVDTPSPE